MTLDVPVSGDLELASTRYFASLTDGTVPLTFHFNGTIFYSRRARSAQGHAGAVELLTRGTGCDSPLA